MLSRVARSAVKATPRVGLIQTQVRFDSTPSLTQAQWESAWIEYFDADICDYWYIRRGLRELLMDDVIPSPEISQVSSNYITCIQCVFFLDVIFNCLLGRPLCLPKK